MFSSRSFRMSGFRLRSLIHLELNFVPDDRYCSNFILLLVDFQFSQQNLLKTLSFLQWVFKKKSSLFIKYQMAIVMSIHACMYFIPLDYMSFVGPVLYYCITIVYNIS